MTEPLPLGPFPPGSLTSGSLRRGATDPGNSVTPAGPARGTAPSGKRTGGLRALAGEALDLVLPRCCPGCGGPTGWCDGCAAALTGRLRSVRLDAPAMDAAAGLALPPVRALARYTGPVRAAILAGKEGARRDLPVRLGAAVGRAWTRSAGPPPPRTQPIWIVPAPSRRAAARRRGGDPVTRMARAAADELAAAGWPVGVAPCLYTASRARDSVGLDAAQRAANLAGRIRFRPRAGPGPGARVLLLDDVVTSGATVVSAVRVLHGRGIGVIDSLFVAAAAPWVRPV